jgi:hypothetical protein
MGRLEILRVQVTIFHGIAGGNHPIHAVPVADMGRHGGFQSIEAAAESAKGERKACVDLVGDRGCEGGGGGIEDCLGLGFGRGIKGRFKGRECFEVGGGEHWAFGSDIQRGCVEKFDDLCNRGGWKGNG